MALTVTHPFVSAVVDEGTAGEISPNDWNASHTVTGATFADAGFDVLFGWDDSAGEHKNMLLADILTEAVPQNGDFVLIYGAEGDLRKIAIATGTASSMPLPNVTTTWSAQQLFTLGVAATISPIVVTNSNNSASVKVLSLEGDRPTGADNDEGYMSLVLSNDAGTQIEFGRLTWVATDANLATGHDGRIDFAVMVAGTLADELQLDGTSLSPSNNDGLQLGTTALGWADLYFAVNGVINWGNAQITLAQTGADSLVIGGASFLPSIDNVSDLGASATRFRDAYLVRALFNSGLGISDGAGNEQLVFPQTASAVNHWAMTNASTGNTPILQCAGDDTNIGMRIATKGTGGIIYNINGTDRSVLTEVSFFPSVDNGLSLGSTTQRWSDLFLFEGGVINWDNGDIVLTQTGNSLAITGGEFVLAAGTTAEPALRFATGGSLMTTPSDGALEMDDNCFYGCTDPGNRGYIPVKHFIRANATRTFTSNTNEQAIFNSPANGTITLETGTYRFEGLICLTGMSGTSGNITMDIVGAGTAVNTAWAWIAMGLDIASGQAGSAVGGSWQVAAQSAGTGLVTAGTATAMAVWVSGSFEISTGGTVIPSLTMANASASVVSIGSYMTFERIGTDAVVSVGQWT